MMDHLVSETEEAELRVQTKWMFENGGVLNVLAAVKTMQECQIIILKKLHELLDEPHA